MMVKTTHIGSLPFLNIEDAINFNKEFDLPVLSTLPNMSSNEFMVNQLSIGISGSSLINFKINIDELEFAPDFKLHFLMLDQFKSEFKRRDIKWQIIGPITFIKSFEDSLSDSQVKKLLNWYQSVILNFYRDHKDSFKKILFILDEPLFDIKFKSELIYILDLLKKTDMDIGIHCCSHLGACDLADIKLDYLSIDCSLYNQQELLSIKNIATNLISGVVDTVTGDICYPISEIIKTSKYFSPTCGLAFSEIKVCHKALSNLSHL